MLKSRRAGLILEDAIINSGFDCEEASGEFDDHYYDGENESALDFFFGLGVCLLALLKAIVD